MRQGFARMGDVTGRSSKRNFLLFAGTLIGIYFTLFILDTQLFEQRSVYEFRSRFDFWGEFKSLLFSNTFRILMALPLISAICRRLHDTNRSTWLLRFRIFAWAGSLLIMQSNSSFLNLGFGTEYLILTAWLLVILLQYGTAGTNTFGPPDSLIVVNVFD